MGITRDYFLSLEIPGVTKDYTRNNFSNTVVLGREEIYAKDEGLSDGSNRDR